MAKRWASEWSKKRKLPIGHNVSERAICLTFSSSFIVDTEMLSNHLRNFPIISIDISPHPPATME